MDISKYSQENDDIDVMNHSQFFPSIFAVFYLSFLGFNFPGRSLCRQARVYLWEEVVFSALFL